MSFDPEKRPRRLALVLGDQLDRDGAVFDGFDPACDAVWMAEVDEEASHVPAHKLRIVAFFAAMRHFRDALRERGITVHYTELAERPSDDRGTDFATVLRKDLHVLRPERLVLTRPGELRVLEAIEQRAGQSEVPLEVREDAHFYCSVERFERWASERKTLVLESFYRTLRKEHEVLIDADGEPVGGSWNFDESNRESFGKEGPGEIKGPRRFRPDDVTKAVIDLVAKRYAGHPGSLEHVDLPLTREEALALLREFVAERLAKFGKFQDAIWEGESFLYHSRLSFALNVKLLSPRECVEKAVEAYEAKQAPIESVEGFVRQILGWREFVRGVYWTKMPGYARGNALRADRDVPSFFWDGETDMRCVADAMRSLRDHAYAHHIQRLMVLGLFAQLLGVHPHRFHEWHLAMYADAVDWVSLPNALGMSQYGDGGVVGTKPYCASGAYLDRMSNHCKRCRYHPKRATGDDACPFTTLYWDFLARHADRFADNRRMTFQLRNLERKDPDELDAIRGAARALKARITKGERI